MCFWRKSIKFDLLVKGNRELVHLVLLRVMTVEPFPILFFGWIWLTSPFREEFHMVPP